MNRTTTAVLSIVAILVLGAASVAGAHPQRRHRGAGAISVLRQARAELGLTDAQTTEIRTIFRTLREQNEGHRRQLREGRQSIADTLIDDPSDLGEARALLERQTQAARAIRLNVLNATSKALSVLTAEQRAKLADLLEERRARR